jgi:hypothetical protein
MLHTVYYAHPLSHFQICATTRMPSNENRLYIALYLSGVVKNEECKWVR